MNESRIPPKFVPTLTEEALQDAADALAAPPDSTAPAVDVLRRRRDADVPGAGVWAQPTADIADLPTYSGWAQQADADLPLGSGAQALAATDEARAQSTVLLSTMLGAEEAQALPSLAGAGAVVDDSDDQNADTLVQSYQGAEGVATTDTTSHLVESAAETAQALEEAITRRVTRRVQETLDARLSAAVLKVVDQQMALLQSSLQLEIDSTIREAVADAVTEILRESQPLQR